MATIEVGLAEISEVNVLATPGVKPTETVDVDAVALTENPTVAVPTAELVKVAS